MDKNIDKRKVNIAIFLAILAHVIYGFGNYFITLCYEYSTPEVTLAYRFLVAFILLNIWFIFGKEKINLKGKNIKGFLLFVLIEPVCFFLESNGIYYTNVTFSGIIVSITPIFAIVLSSIFLKEYPTKLQAIFCLLPIVGVIIITLAGKSLGVVRPIGVILLILYSISSATYKTTNRGISNEFTTFERTYFLIGICAVTYVIYALISCRNDFNLLIEPLNHIGFIIPTLALTLLNSLGCVLMTNYSAKYISATKMANYSSITTLTAAFSGVFILNEAFDYRMLIGMILIIVGVYVVSTKGE